MRVPLTASNGVAFTDMLTRTWHPARRKSGGANRAASTAPMGATLGFPVSASMVPSGSTGVRLPVGSGISYSARASISQGALEYSTRILRRPIRSALTSLESLTPAFPSRWRAPGSIAGAASEWVWVGRFGVGDPSAHARGSRPRRSQTRSGPTCGDRRLGGADCGRGAADG